MLREHWWHVVHLAAAYLAVFLGAFVAPLSPLYGFILMGLGVYLRSRVAGDGGTLLSAVCGLAAGVVLHYLTGPRVELFTLATLTFVVMCMSLAGSQKWIREYRYRSTPVFLFHYSNLSAVAFAFALTFAGEHAAGMLLCVGGLALAYLLCPWAERSRTHQPPPAGE